MRIAVVGAGIAGLSAARRLHDDGHAVVVFERGDRPGGRVATMRTEVGGFDHGAQYFTAREPAFVEETARWRAAGVVADWDAAVRAIPADAEASASPPPQRSASGGATVRWVGVPGMSAVPVAMADGLDVRAGAAVGSIEVDECADASVDAPTRAGWRLRLRPSDAASSIDQATEPDAGAAFDAVVVATPAPLAAALLTPVPSLAAEIARVRIEPCWALTIGFAAPIAIDAGRTGDATFVAGGRLAWIARDSAKPGRRAGERWTVHAQSAWSVEHFDDDPEDAKAKLLKAFHDATGSVEQPVYATVHRWRHALVRAPLSCGFLWDPARRVGACGDWCRGARVEDAWSSGRALALAIGRAD